MVTKNSSSVYLPLRSKKVYVLWKRTLRYRFLSDLLVALFEVLRKSRLGDFCSCLHINSGKMHSASKTCRSAISMEDADVKSQGKVSVCF